MVFIYWKHKNIQSTASCLQKQAECVLIKIFVILYVCVHLVTWHLNDAI